MKAPVAALRFNVTVALLAGVAVVMTACTGTVSPVGVAPGGRAGSGGSGSGAGPGPAVPPSGIGAAMGSGGSSGGPMVVIPTQPVPESAGAMVMRRLSHREFDHTLRDLLGDTTNPADAWPPDNETNTKFEAPTDFAENIVQRVEESANAVVDKALADNRLTPLIPCTNPTAGAAETTCAKDFITTFGRKAYRRPVSPAEAADLLAVFTYARSATVGLDFKTSIGYVAKALLQSPNFLYHWELGPTKPVKDGALVALTPHQIASRLSYLFWESMPDDALLDAADAGQLVTPEQIATQAQRLLTANKARAADSMYSFHKQWLVYPNLDSVAKNTALYPAFTDAFRDSLVPEITAFLSSVMVDGDGTFKTLFTAPYAFVNESTAPVYGVSVTGTALKRVELNPAQRGGILTQAAFLSTSGQPSNSDPIRRGLIILERVMCGHAPPPPPDLKIPDLAPVSPTGTTRQRYAAHDSMPCAFCHTTFDPPGYAFENYDGIGAYRTMEGGQQVDATGSLTTPESKTPVSFKNALELSTFLATNDEVRACLGRQWFRFMLGRIETDAETGSIQAALKQATATTPDFSIRDLLIGMAKSKAFRYRQPAAGETL